MRTLILLLSLGVVALAVSIVIYVDRREPQRRSGPLFRVHELLPDAHVGEEVTYREQNDHRRMVFRVEETPVPQMMQAPVIVIRRELLDRAGNRFRDSSASVSYPHSVTNHGWFPLTAPEVPDALDRVWIVQSIRKEKVRWRNQERECWRVDLIDPALPENADTVVAWLDPEVPVYGLLKWRRMDETWVLEQFRE